MSFGEATDTSRPRKIKVWERAELNLFSSISSSKKKQDLVLEFDSTEFSYVLRFQRSRK